MIRWSVLTPHGNSLSTIAELSATQHKCGKFGHQ